MLPAFPIASDSPTAGLGRSGQSEAAPVHHPTVVGNGRKAGFREAGATRSITSWEHIFAITGSLMSLGES